MRANDVTPMVVINQVAPISVGFSVPERRLTELKRCLVKGPVVVAAVIPGSEGPPEKGRVSFVDNAVDRTTGTIRVKGTFDNRSRHL